MSRKAVPISWDARCPQFTFTLWGRWWRFFAGVTGWSTRFRFYRGYGFALVAVRLYGDRLVGISTRREVESDNK